MGRGVLRKLPPFSDKVKEKSRGVRKGSCVVKKMKIWNRIHLKIMSKHLSFSTIILPEIVVKFKIFDLNCEWRYFLVSILFTSLQGENYSNLRKMILSCLKAFVSFFLSQTLYLGVIHKVNLFLLSFALPKQVWASLNLNPGYFQYNLSHICILKILFLQGLRYVYKWLESKWWCW